MTIRGIAFPFTKGTTSFPAVRTDDDVVEDNIRRILTTPRFSRVMRPDDGSDMLSLVFENRGPVLSARIDSEVRRAIGAGEPRARVLATRVTEQPRTDGEVEILVEITYEVSGIVRKMSVTYTAVV